MCNYVHTQKLPSILLPTRTATCSFSLMVFALSTSSLSTAIIERSRSFSPFPELKEPLSAVSAPCVTPGHTNTGNEVWRGVGGRRWGAVGRRVGNKHETWGGGQGGRVGRGGAGGELVNYSIALHLQVQPLLVECLQFTAGLVSDEALPGRSHRSGCSESGSCRQLHRRCMGAIRT